VLSASGGRDFFRLYNFFHSVATMGKKGKSPKGRAGAKKKAQKSNANTPPAWQQFSKKRMMDGDDDGMSSHCKRRSFLMLR